MDSNHSSTNNRRKFLKNTALVASVGPFISMFSGSLFQYNHTQQDLQIHLFSKHVQFLDYERMAEEVAKAGFDGVDLTVRSGGHVLPEKVEKDLPRAVNAIQQAGMDSIIMATNVSDAGKELDQRVLKTAAEHGISHYRMEHYKYLKGKSIPDSIAHYQDQLEKLGKLNEALGIIGCYQNHAGTNMGSSIWELNDMLDGSNPNYMGAQYDIRHATVEGGLNWSRGLQLIQPRIRSFVIKDFKWGMVDGQWRAINVPFGEGMVDFPSYFALLKQYNIRVPVSLHMEYSMGGAEHGRRNINVDEQVVFDAMKRDLENVRRVWKDA